MGTAPPSGEPDGPAQGPRVRVRGDMVDVGIVIVAQPSQSRFQDEEGRDGLPAPSWRVQSLEAQGVGGQDDDGVGPTPRA